MTRDQDALALRLLGTGNPELDQILGGGIPAGSLTMVCGEPGAGKTILALQLLFNFARQGMKSLFFTTLSEPTLKLIRYMQFFSFFDQQLIDNQIVLVDLGTSLRTKSAPQLLQQLSDRADQEGPDLVVVDSFKAVHDFFDDPSVSRQFVYDLAVQLSAGGATTFLVGEYTREDISREHEFAIADGIIHLTNRREELNTVREMEVVKLRGANCLTGGHFFEIGPDGLVFFPRVRAPEIVERQADSIEGRASIGVPGLDDLFQGGLPLSSSTLIQGGSGTGKTLLGIHFLVKGAEAGEPGILFTLEETPDQIRGIARGFGWDLPNLEAQKLLQICYTSPVELSPARFLHEIRQRITSLAARRVVLDSVTSAALSVASQRRFHEFIYSLAKHCRASDVTIIMTMEMAELFGTAQLTGHGVSSMADNIILLRYAEIAGRIDRAISVLKARGISHKTDLCRLVITSDGAQIGAPFGLRGVLTGLPIIVPGSPEEPQPRQGG
jgi:circadian clock protein KaiC